MATCAAMPNGDVCCAAIAAASSWTGSTTLGFGRALPRRCHSIDGCSIGTGNGAAMNRGRQQSRSQI